MLSQNRECCYQLVSQKVIRSYGMVLDFLLWNKGSQTVSVTVFRSLIEWIVSEEIAREDLPFIIVDFLHEPSYSSNLKTKIESETSGNSFME